MELIIHCTLSAYKELVFYWYDLGNDKERYKFTVKFKVIDKLINLLRQHSITNDGTWNGHSGLQKCIIIVIYCKNILETIML